MKAPRIIIAGTGSNVGKTTATLALLSAFTAKGRIVQSFKAGPDFIDPGHHEAVTSRPSRNLDGWMLGRDVNRAIFIRAAAGADLSIVEGMMGLFDGSSPVSELGSTAELAKQLEAPVLLVIDGSAMARSAAAMVEGFARFDPTLHVAGVLFNRVNSGGHYRLLKEAVEQLFNVEVIQVNVTNNKPKEKSRNRRRTRIKGWTSSWKKAVVTLAAGQKIEFFEGV